MIKTAILIDGGFIVKRLRYIYPTENLKAPEIVADKIHKMALQHIYRESEKDKEMKIQEYLYRIFFYDCPPLEKKVQYPISKKALDFSKTEEAQFRNQLHQLICTKRKVALRLGALAEYSAGWKLKPDILKQLLHNKLSFSDLKDSDFTYDIKQKGVDMKIGIDITSLALKKQVDKIILISGDSDFVPAAKLARREGIDFVLDPLWFKIDKNLSEHVDGIQSVCPKPKEN